MRVKHAATVAHFRRLCCLELPSQTVVPALLQVLHELIPADTARFIWCDAYGRISGIYAENADEYIIGERFFREYGGKVDDVWPDFAMVARCGPSVGFTLPYQTGTFYDSDYYNLFERPMGVHHLLDAVIADERGPLGCVILTRGSRATLFSPAEQATLASLTRYFVHALRTPGRACFPYEACARSGMAIVDRHGRIRFADAKGLHLLMMASQGLAPRQGPPAHMSLPADAMRVCKALEQVRCAETGPPPSRLEVTPWGLFEYRASWLRDRQAENESLVAIRIDLHAPRNLELTLRMRTLGLSARQQDVCQLLIEGLSKTQIAIRLGVRTTTVVDHLDKIYCKLDVHDKMTLAQRLLGQPREGTFAGEKW